VKIKKYSLFFITVILFLIAASSASAVEMTTGTVVPISHTEHASPAIYGDKIVWVENSPYSDSSIYLYDLSSNKGKQISTSSSAGSPAIYGDKVIWLDRSNFTRKVISVDDRYMYSGNSHIHVYDISSGEETQITTSESIKGPPEIYEDKIVWSDYRNGKLGIYMYNMSAGEESEITSHPYQGSYVGIGDEIIDGEHEIIYAPAGSINLAIYDNTIAWENNSTIYIYDILTGEEKRVTNDEAMIFAGPALYEDKIIWSDLRDYPNSPAYAPISLSDIYMYNISSGEEIQITTNETLGHESLKFSPAIYEDVIVWADSTSIAGPSRIYMYKISSGEAFQLPTNGWDLSMNHPSPAIYRNRIVWEGWIYDTSHIGLFTLNEQVQPDPEDSITEPIGDTPDEVPTEEDSIKALEEIQDYISDMEGVNTGTKTSLSANIKNAIHMLEIENAEKSIDRLNKVIASIEGQLLPKGRLSNEQAEYIVNELERIIELIRTPQDMTTPNATDEVVTKITLNGSVYSQSLAIYEDRVAWIEKSLLNDENQSFIYSYNISTDQKVLLMEVQKAENLAIYKDIIVWQDGRNGNSDIYMYNIVTEEEQQITTSTANQTDPEIYGDIIVWTDDSSSNWDIYMYKISTGDEKQITASGMARNPAIYGSTIAWVGYSSSNYSSTIYMYDIPTGEIKQVSTEGAVPVSGPAIYEDKIVWSDSRDNTNVGVTLSESLFQNLFHTLFQHSRKHAISISPLNTTLSLSYLLTSFLNPIFNHAKNRSIAPLLT